MQHTQGTNFNKTLPLWNDWLCSEAKDEQSYFITMTFDRYREFYFTEPSNDIEASPVSRMDVGAGLARRMPQAEAATMFVGDVNRWYLRLLKSLCGGRYGDHRNLHPKAVGFLDDPVQKGARKGVRKLLPGDRFVHAHIVMTISDRPCPGKSGVGMIAEFERLWHDGKLETMWKRLNPEGVVHVEDVLHDRLRTIDYAAKSAKRSETYRDEMILLPFRQ